MKHITPRHQKPARQRTEKQKEASRQNGKKSQGPQTEAGKEKSSANSYDHGLYSKKIFLLRIEKSEEFERTCRMFQTEWQPSGPTEATLVRSLALESISLDRFRMIQAEALNAMSDRVPLDMFYDDVTAGPVTLDQLSGGQLQYAGLEKYTLDGNLPNLALIDRLIARADRTFRASLTSLLHLRKVGPASLPVHFDGLKPTPPGEPSESLERRITGFRAREEAEKAAADENEQTNLPSAQPKSNQPIPVPAQPGNRPGTGLPALPAPPLPSRGPVRRPVSTRRNPGRENKL